MVNSVCHIIGRRRYATRDQSRNNLFVALVAMGEGWHNNHHHYQSSANQGFFWWEIDLSYYVLRLLSYVGVVWGIRTPPEAKRKGPLDVSELSQDKVKASEQTLPLSALLRNLMVGATGSRCGPAAVQGGCGCNEGNESGSRPQPQPIR
jgi:stearoyl-CoA desaturase (delta-9 desaturase)